MVMSIWQGHTAAAAAAATAAAAAAAAAVAAAAAATAAAAAAADLSRSLNCFDLGRSLKCSDLSRSLNCFCTHTLQKGRPGPRNRRATNPRTGGHHPQNWRATNPRTGGRPSQELAGDHPKNWRYDHLPRNGGETVVFRTPAEYAPLGTAPCHFGFKKVQFGGVAIP